MSSRSRRRESGGNSDPYYERRKRYEAVLHAVGLAESFARMPRLVQEQFWKRKVPDPVLAFDESVPADRAGRLMRRAVEKSFRSASFQIGEGAAAATMSVRDFLSVLTGCKLVVEHTPPAVGDMMPGESPQFFRAARDVLAAFFQKHLMDAWRAMYVAVHEPLAEHSRLDTRIHAARTDCLPCASGKKGAWVIVSMAKPQVRKVTLDGEPRNMYRAVVTVRQKMEWISWKPEIIGRDPAGPELPVYVQSHALRQLHQRVNIASAAPHLESWLAHSLAEPKIVERQGADWLVEFRLNDGRVGYLVATALKDLVAVRTFLFLTMEPTPESRLLKKQLKLTRREADWLGLHDLAAFTQTDLSQDAVLRPMLEACGCGHLFSLAAEDFTPDQMPQLKAFAAEMRRYLRLAA